MMKSRIFIAVIVVTIFAMMFLGTTDVSAKKNKSKGLQGDLVAKAADEKPVLYIRGEEYDENFMPQILICKELKKFSSMAAFKDAIAEQYDAKLVFYYTDRNGFRTAIIPTRYATRKPVVLEDPTDLPSPMDEVQYNPGYREEEPMTPPIYSDGDAYYTPDGFIGLVAPPICLDEDGNEITP